MGTVDLLLGDVVDRATVVARSFNATSQTIVEIDESQVSVAAAVEQQSALLCTPWPSRCATAEHAPRGSAPTDGYPRVT